MSIVKIKEFPVMDEELAKTAKDAVEALIREIDDLERKKHEVKEEIRALSSDLLEEEEALRKQVDVLKQKLRDFLEMGEGALKVAYAGTSVSVSPGTTSYSVDAQALEHREDIIKRYKNKKYKGGRVVTSTLRIDRLLGLVEQKKIPMSEIRELCAEGIVSESTRRPSVRLKYDPKKA